MRRSAASSFFSLAVLFALRSFAHGESLFRLDEAMPRHADISTWFPVFDFDGDACFPSAGFSRRGRMNNGLKASGSVTGMCRDDNFMDKANTYHRYACSQAKNATYCGHSFALYFLKDQKSVFGGGHRHDWENVILWFKSGELAFVSYSIGGGGMVLRIVHQRLNDSDCQRGHRKFVYHKRGAGLHSFRPAKSHEVAENPHEIFVAPPIVSWFTMTGDGLTNEQLRAKINFENAAAGSDFPHADDRFADMLNQFRPRTYPPFSADSTTNSQ